MLNKPYSRRRFMKSSAALSLGMTVEGRRLLHPSSPQKAFKAASRTSLKSLTTVPTTCEQCPAGCGVIACLNGDRLVQIYGNPDHPFNRGGLCAKGIAGINLSADPERLLFPLKRVGPRGEGQWTRITWDEAYAVLAERIRALHRQDRLGEFVMDSGRSGILLDRFRDAVGIEKHMDRHLMKNSNRAAAFHSMAGTDEMIEDVAGSRTILNFGANPYANHDRFLNMARELVHARIENGARLITFDVRLSETAARSDEWIPIRAGTDGMIALAMAHVIVENGMTDTAFIEHSTNVSFAQLKRHLADRTPEAAEKETGVEAAKIVKLALEFASRKPALAISGGGIGDHVHGIQNLRCVALLNWIVGNLEKPGGLFILPDFELDAGNASFIQRRKQYAWPSLESMGKNGVIDTYMAYKSNPAYSDPDCGAIQRLLKDEARIPLLVVMDTHLTETAMLADLALPAATYLESWNVKTTPLREGGYLLNLTQPAVSLLSTAQTLRLPDFETGKLLEASYRPRGESKDIGDVCLDIAKRMGGAVKKTLAFKNTKDFIARTVAAVPGCDFETLKHKGFWVGKVPAEKNPRVPERINIYFKSPKNEELSTLPEYIPVAHPEQENEFVLTSFKSNLGLEATANSKWAREILHENRLWIHRGAAKRLNIGNGDRVRVTSSVGELIVRALTTSLIQPGSVALVEGLGHTAVGRIATARKFKSSDLDTDLIWWSKAGRGVNPKAIIESTRDDHGGGCALKDTLVRVEKA